MLTKGSIVAKCFIVFVVFHNAPQIQWEES